MNAAPTDAHFTGAAPSVAQARHFVAGVLGSRYPELCEVAVLAVSELASNAVVHGGSGFSVHVEDLGDGIKVTVTDAGPGRPVVRHPGVRERHGRGLQIVDRLAGSWGVTAGAAGRKAVWFELRTPPT